MFLSGLTGLNHDGLSTIADSRLFVSQAERINYAERKEFIIWGIQELRDQLFTIRC